MKLKEAAEWTGKSRTALLRAIQEHRISAEKNDKGQWEIDPAELVRVYDVAIPEDAGGVRRAHVRTPVNGAPRTGSGAHPDTAQISEEMENLRRALEASEALAKDRERTVVDLRERLDRSEEQRSRAQEKLTALIEDHRTPSPVARAPFLWALGLAIAGAAGLAGFVLSK